MSPAPLVFRPIDLERHAGPCVAFRRDSYVCSFGTDEEFLSRFGPEGAGYVRWLRERLAEVPEGTVRVWQGDDLIGQIELYVRSEPTVGYINPFYLVPARRGAGLGKELHEYALRFFRERNVGRLQLSVSPTNLRALSFYREHGWRDLGPRPGREIVRLMELVP